MTDLFGKYVLCTASPHHREEGKGQQSRVADSWPCGSVGRWRTSVHARVTSQLQGANSYSSFEFGFSEIDILLIS